ncbi:5-oxoprolinase subunit PxpB [Vibrio caribbeanicus]|uniref:5-oxoprolinase subunit PxpB n=1 Tax=Vibrio caribbeanicus TaxID=701175 RepID=UPI0030DC021C
MKIEPVNETSCIIYFGESINDENADTIRSAIPLIKESLADILVDIIPSYTSILVIYDFRKVKQRACIKRLTHCLTLLSQHSGSNHSNRVIDIPTYYGDEVALDMAYICKSNGLSVEQVIELHCQKTYNVYAIGFSPGFAYLGSVDDKIKVSRKPTPRLSVPMGSVGIADDQTAVYPSSTPGGWQIIGRTPIKMMDFQSENLTKVSVGDKVRFNSISKQQYLELGGVLG